MTIRATLTIIAVGCCVSIANQLAPQVTSARAQDIAQIANKDKNLVSKTDKKKRYTSFPSAGVKMIRPAGFDAADGFDGFQQPSTQSSVMAIKIPGSFAQVTGGFTVDRLKLRGMTLRSKENITIDGDRGLLVRITQSAYGIEFSQWTIAFGNDRETKMVTATFPTERSAKLSALLKSVVLTTKTDATPPPKLGTDVGFTIAASEKVKLTQGMGKMLLYTKDGEIPAKSPADPLFIVAPSFSQVSIADKRQYSTQKLFQTAHTTINSVTETNAIKIDGLDGYEIVADGKDTASGSPLAVYQVMLFDDRSYILMQGLVGSQIRNEYLPEFRAMARSFKKQRK